jgi:predicted esterase
MNKIFKLILAAIGLTVLLYGCNKQTDSTTLVNERKDLKMKGEYSLIMEGFDWGPAITKAIIKMDKAPESIDKNDFTVKVKRSAKELLSGSEGERAVTQAYVSDEKGNFLEGGDYIAIEMKIGPTEILGSPFNYNVRLNLNQWVESEYTVSQKSTGEVWNLKGEEKVLVSSDFVKDSVTYKDITLGYAAYKPAADNKKNSLIIWLHGAGEGGTDPTIALIGNKVVNLASKEIQSIFDGAYILAPQAPTMWMDGGNGQYAFDGSSMYTESLMNLIQSYVENTPDIDRSRIYIGGCSNGGFMTMNMLLTYPEYFAAAYPVCEAYYDTNISDEQINTIKDIPIWFTHSKNDPVVHPEQTTLKTYTRLLEAGAEDVHFTYWDKVEDTTGLYKNEDGTPYSYHGHFSWIYALNNECTIDYNGKPVVINGKDVTIMEWLAAHSL